MKPHVHSIYFDTEGLRCKFCRTYEPKKSRNKVASLIGHIENQHLFYKQAVCPLCGETFTRDGSFAYHIPLHFNIYTYDCEFCSKKFSHRDHYFDHWEDTHGVCFPCKKQITLNNDKAMIADHVWNFHARDKTKKRTLEEIKAQKENLHMDTAVKKIMKNTRTRALMMAMNLFNLCGELHSFKCDEVS